MTRGLVLALPVGFFTMGSALRIGANVAVGIALLGGGYFAMKKGKRNEATLKARDQVERLLLPLSKCLAESVPVGLPSSAAPIPARLADTVEGYSPTKKELAPTVYQCAAARLEGPLFVQVRWRKESEERGSFFVSLDADGDGVSDEWYEAPVECASGECARENYVFSVSEDGVRRPPPLLESKVRPYQEKPPRRIEEEAPGQGSGAVATRTSSAKTDSAALVAKESRPAPTLELKGQPVSLALLEGQFERTAREKLPGAAMVNYAVVGASDDTIDPGAGESLQIVYGVPGSDLVVPKMSELTVLKYEKTGVKVTTEKARAQLHSIAPPTCVASKVISIYTPNSLGLVTEGKDHRSLWVANVTKPKKKAILLTTEDCALTKGRR